MKQDLLPGRRELIRHLFADITSALEIAHTIAATGQSSKLAHAEYARCAKRLQAATKDIVTLAAAVSVVLCPVSEDTHESE